MKKRIALIGLSTFENLGDRILCDATNYLIGKCNPEYEVIRVNQYPPIRKNNILKINNLLYCFICGINKTLDKVLKNDLCHNMLELAAWKIRLLGYYKVALKNVDAAILAGGTIKYSNQGVNYAYEFAVRQAEKYNIPVMFNAMSVETFDGQDSRCIRLQNVLNSSSVKAITTRDGENGVKELKEHYIYNRDIVVCAVGDPALWVSEVYGIKKDERSEKIGVGLIRADIFKMYGRKKNANEVIEYYEKIARKLESENAEWNFFSNGLKVDQVEGEKIVNRLNLSKKCLQKRPIDMEELVKIVSSYKCIIGARMHSQILAYALDIPMVGIEWDDKIVHFFRSINGDDYLIREDELDVDPTFQKLVSHKLYDDLKRRQLKEHTLDTIRQFLALEVS